MIKKRYKKAVTIGLTLSLFLSVFSIMPTPVKAAGVQVTVSSPANGEFTGTATQDVTFGYTTSSTEFAISDTVTVTVSPALGSALASCTTPTQDSDGDSTNDGSFGSLTTTGAVYTYSQPTTLATTSGIDLCLRFPASTAQGSYSISVVDNNDNDYGLVLVYVADDNDVTVSATVGPSLSFNIRTVDDTADTNICDMGLVTTSAAPDQDTTYTEEGECAYSLAIGTNIETGVNVNVLEQGNFTNGTHNMTDVTNNVAFSAGVETYGFSALEIGTGLTGLTTQGNFTDDDSANEVTAVPSSSTLMLQSSGPLEYVSGTDASDVTIVAHGLSIATDTPAGVYSHVVSYYVTAAY